MVATPPISQLVTIGASAGGIEALSTLVSTLPANFPAPLVVAQHLDPSRPSHLETILARHSSLSVQTVVDQAVLEPSVVYVVPSDRHIRITNHHVSVERDGAGHPKPSIDLLFRTASEVFGEGLIAVVLSGLGTDGAAGARQVKEAGGTVVIQNPRTAQYPSMPQALAPTTVDVIADVDAMGPILLDLLTGAYTPEGPSDDRQLRTLLVDVRARSGIDFGHYKVPTIQRRLQRRLVATGTRTLEEYRSFLQQHPEEYGRLVNAFLIKVTEFFRDRDLFSYLRHRVIPDLIAQGRERGKELRLWSAGCATGEEAYSLATIIADALGDELDDWTVRIFATDLDAEAVDFARRGVYPASALDTAPPDLLTRYFTSDDGSYTVTKTIRNLLAFGEHDLGQRPPFPRIDLAVCRNVLIYFTPELQQRALELLAFALRNGGYLVLGKAETTNPLATQFTSVRSDLRIYQRHGDRHIVPTLIDRTGAVHGRSAAPLQSVQELARVRREAQQAQEAQLAAEELLLRLPVGVVVVDRRYDIKRINSLARRLLGIHGLAVGEDLIHLVQGVPSTDVRALIDDAMAGETRTLDAFKSETMPGETRYLHIRCQPQVPVRDGTPAEAAILVIVDVTDIVRGQQVEQEAQLALAGEVKSLQAEVDRLNGVVKQVTTTNRSLLAANEELTSANILLRSSNEEYSLSSDEVQAAAEEVETLNEELQASIEELETLNEEQQATVEELETTNSELSMRSREMQDLAAILDAQRRRLAAILSSMGEAVVVFDQEGRAVFTSALFNHMLGTVGPSFVPEDAEGHPLDKQNTPQQRLRRGEVFQMEFTLTDSEGQRHWYEATGRPICGDDPHQDAVLVIRDISDRTLRRLQDQFLAMATHELRTPLTPLAGYMDLLNKGFASGTDAARMARYANIAQQELRRLRRMVDDLLDVSRLQAGKLSIVPSPTNLTALVPRVVDNVTVLAVGHPIRLDLPDEPIVVRGDELRLEQVLFNLLTNALTYAPESAIEVRLSRTDGMAELQVQDYGPGIVATALPHLFTRFYQVSHGTHSSREGMGLGLYIAREIVQAHGGTISVDSALNVGTTFTVRLPLLETEQEQA